MTGLTVLAMCAHESGRFDEGGRILDNAARLLDDISNAELAPQLGAAFYLARMEFWLDRFAVSVRHADRGLALARATGQAQYLLSLNEVQTGPLLFLGRLREASELSEEVVASARLTGIDQVLMLALMDRTYVATATGDLSGAIAAGEDAQSLADRLPKSGFAAVVGWGMAAALLESGQPDRAAATLLDPRCLAATEGGALTGHFLGWHYLVRAEAQRGQLDEAERWLDRLDAELPKIAGLPPAPMPRGASACRSALCARRVGDRGQRGACFSRGGGRSRGAGRRQLRAHAGRSRAGGCRRSGTGDRPA